MAKTSLEQWGILAAVIDELDLSNANVTFVPTLTLTTMRSERSPCAGSRRATVPHCAGEPPATAMRLRFGCHARAVMRSGSPPMRRFRVAPSAFQSVTS